MSIDNIAACAVRYALTRASYVSASVPREIMEHIDEISANTISVMIKDIFNADYGNGMECDRENWMRFVVDLNKELDRRFI